MEASQNSYHFNIGHFECLIISDGRLEVSETDQIMDFNGLLIRTGQQTILVDTGLGIGGQPLGGKLIDNLQAAGIQNTDIDTVIFSHAHGDHISGNTDTEGRLVFPNARYVMDKKEWEFWTSDPNLSQLDLEDNIRQWFIWVVQNKLLPIKDRLLFIDGETDIVPGIKAIRIPGHTPGHILLFISSGAEQLISLGDIFHGPEDIGQPDKFDYFDTAREIGRRQRIELLSRGILTGKLIFACHFPFPGLGHIIPKNNAWLWQPLETNAAGQSAG